MVVNSEQKGYALLIAIFALTIFSILVLSARSLWETEVRREMEEELIFRGEQFVTAIERYIKMNNNQYPENLNILYEKKFLRKFYPDPLGETGIWNIVMQPRTPGSKKLYVVKEEFISKLIGQAQIIGVCSTSKSESFREYRGKKQYHEWAFYYGEKVEEEMPTLEFVGY